MEKYKVVNSESGHQWYVMQQENGEWKICKVFYSKEKCEAYIEAQSIVSAAIAS